MSGLGERKMEIYKNNFIYTKYDKKAPAAMAWKAYTGNEQSYSDTEESAIRALKDKLDCIENFRLGTK